MLVIHQDSEEIEHRGFSDLPEFLRPSDLLVLNDSRVIPARLHDASGKIEILLLEQYDSLHWTAMVRPGKKMRQGATIEVAGTTATVLEILEDGTRLLAFSSPPDMEHFGSMPTRSPRPRRDSTSHRRSLLPYPMRSRRFMSEPAPSNRSNLTISPDTGCTGSTTRFRRRLLLGSIRPKPQEDGSSPWEPRRPGCWSRNRPAPCREPSVRRRSLSILRTSSKGSMPF